MKALLLLLLSLSIPARGGNMPASQGQVASLKQFFAAPGGQALAADFPSLGGIGSDALAAGALTAHLPADFDPAAPAAAAQMRAAYAAAIPEVERTIAESVLSLAQELHDREIGARELSDALIELTPYRVYGPAAEAKLQPLRDMFAAARARTMYKADEIARSLMADRFEAELKILPDAPFVEAGGSGMSRPTGRRPLDFYWAGSDRIELVPRDRPIEDILLTMAQVKDGQKRDRSPYLAVDSLGIVTGIRVLSGIGTDLIDITETDGRYYLNLPMFGDPLLLQGFLGEAWRVLGGQGEAVVHNQGMFNRRPSVTELVVRQKRIAVTMPGRFLRIVRDAGLSGGLIAAASYLGSNDHVLLTIGALLSAFFFLIGTLIKVTEYRDLKTKLGDLASHENILRNSD